MPIGYCGLETREEENMIKTGISPHAVCTLGGPFSSPYVRTRELLLEIFLSVPVATSTLQECLKSPFPCPPKINSLVFQWD